MKYFYTHIYSNFWLCQQIERQSKIQNNEISCYLLADMNIQQYRYTSDALNVCVGFLLFNTVLLLVHIKPNSSPHA